jgi:hypothetical protein
MLVGAYYYAWYSGDWLSRTIRKDDPPAMGEYDNTVRGPSPGTGPVAEHFRQLKSNGIDFVSVSWEPDRNYDHVYEAAQATGMKVTCLYESLIRANAKKFLTGSEEQIVREDMSRISDDTEEDCWLRMNGDPVVMLYVTRQYKEPRLFDAIREEIEGAFIVGDDAFWKDLKPERIRLFDAVTAYNMYRPDRFSGDTPEERSESFLTNSARMLESHARKCDGNFWPVAMPGYDDTGVRPGERHPSLSRLDGEFLERSLDCAANLQPACTMITSANEWYEDTQIEPAGSYGDKYLRIIKRKTS